MRTPYAVSFMLVLLLGGTYWFTHAQARCDLPLTYRIGEIDPRFELSFEEARTAMTDAEAVWEDATGKNLFSYDPTADFSVNFIFDERQALTEAERDLRERLDQSENINERIDEQYAELVAEYNTLNLQYKDKVEAYERRLNTYNKKVQTYNESGGAPPDVYDELEAEKKALDAEQAAINKLANQLNQLVTEINRIGEEGNRLIDMHNRQVEVYNRTFGHEREFTQGDFRRENINIYTWTNRDELVLVLAHELGHAIELEHVENESSLMYYLMGGQPETLTLSDEDLVEFERVCGEGSAYKTVVNMATQIRSWLQL